jgi:hypothetical protein
MQSAKPSIAADHITPIRVYGAAGNMTEAHEHKGDLKEW